MAIEVLGAPLSALDLLGIILFLAIGIGYHSAYALYARTHPLTTVKGKIHLFRRTWVKRILDRKDYILAVQTVRNLMMSANFLATASLLSLSLVFNIVILQSPENVAMGLHIDNPAILTFKLYTLALIFGFSFWEFLLSIRYLNQLSVLVGADPDMIEQVEGVDAVSYLTTLLNRATNRYTYGQRAFYFATAIFAWIFSPIAFIAVTAGLGFFFIGAQDFQRWRPPKTMQPDAQT